MGIVVDIILILMIVGNAFIGYKVGLTKVVFSIFSSIVAIILVFILYKPVTNLVYHHTEVAQKLENIITEEVMQNTSNSLVTYATNKVSYNIISGIVYIALFAVIRIILAIVEKSVDFLANLPFIKTVNSSGGMIYGIIRGFFAIYVMFAILSFMVPVLGDNVIISSINNAYIGSRMFNNNILLNLIFKFL